MIRGKSVVYNYADQVTRLVESRNIDELAKLSIPSTDKATSTLQTWTSSYVAEMQRQEAQRQKQYDEAVSKAENFLKRDKYDEAMDQVVRVAFQIAKDQDAFLQQAWVKDLTTKVAARAADLEKQGQWLESFQLYSDLNSLYEVDTRYKADMQRLARRTRLLAMYTPKTLVEMRKALIAKQEKENAADHPTTAPATQPADDDDGAFSKLAGLRGGNRAGYGPGCDPAGAQ